ncbi:hypothetical protein ACI3PL_30795, partial [Lacticaseibacillus paracasei]
MLHDYRALYRGGHHARKQMHRFLPQRPTEPNDHYQFRLQSAHYLNYAGPIVDYFVAQLFTGRIEVRSEPIAP